MALFSYKYKLNYLGELDKIAVVAPLAGAFIRLGNLMNSEVIGSPSNLPFAFIFYREDSQPRHPAQLYEAISYFIIFFILWSLYKKLNPKVSPGFFFGLSIALIFTARFLIEFVKENQEFFENDLLLDMGQLLSIPFIICGLTLAIIRFRRYSYNQKI